MSIKDCIWTTVVVVVITSILFGAVKLSTEYLEWQNVQGESHAD